MSQALVPSLQWRILPGGVPMTATKMSNGLLPSRGVGLKSAPFNGRLSRSKRSTLHGRNYVSSVRADSVAWNPTENGSASRLIDLLNLDLSPFTDKVIAEYLWIGGSGLDIRSKARTVSGPIDNPAKLPKWNYDGSSTGQAPGEDSEVILYPQAIFKDPFRGGNNILVICDSYKPNGEPIPTNKRANAAKIFSQKKVIDEEPWYGIEQEYTLLQKNVKWPLGWPIGGYPGPQVNFRTPYGQG